MPGTPPTLKTATKEKHAGLIDVTTHPARIDERRASQLHAKKHPDTAGKQTLRCLPPGDSLPVTFPLRELAKKAANQERPGIELDDVPEFLDRICQQHSVSLTEEGTLWQQQGFGFVSEERDEFHDRDRQSMESLHGEFMDDGKQLVVSSGRRRA